MSKLLDLVEWLYNDKEEISLKYGKKEKNLSKYDENLMNCKRKKMSWRK